MTRASFPFGGADFEVVVDLDDKATISRNGRRIIGAEFADGVLHNARYLSAATRQVCGAPSEAVLEAAEAALRALP